MKLTVEYSATGPLRHRATLSALEDAVANAATLDEANRAVLAIPSLATYCGGSHIAVHPVWKGRFAHGSPRLAIITEGTV